MALIKCPECGSDISSEADKCIHCGYPIQSKKSCCILTYRAGPTFSSMKKYTCRILKRDPIDSRFWNDLTPSLSDKETRTVDIGQDYILLKARCEYGESTFYASPGHHYIIYGTDNPSITDQKK